MQDDTADNSEPDSVRKPARHSGRRRLWNGCRVALSTVASTDTGSALILVAFAGIALILANVQVGIPVLRFAGTPLPWMPAILGEIAAPRQLVNEGLMVFFFLVVGLEMKRELLFGHLASTRKALLPVVAAVGGMIGPALIYLLFNPLMPQRAGWAVPTATDIAFSLGVAALVGKGFLPQMRAFLLTLAVADDIGGVLVMALVYHSSIEPWWLAAAIGGCVGLWAFGKLADRNPWLFLVGLVPVWYALLMSGVHAALAGVLVSLTVPVFPRSKIEDAAAIQAELDPVNPLAVHLPPVDSALGRLEQPVSGLVRLAILPCFALMNALVRFNGAASSSGYSVLIGTAVALSIGVPAGATLFAFLTVKSGLGALPEGVRWRDMVGIGLCAGVGFTVALLVADRAFTYSVFATQARIGIVAGCIMATLFSLAYFRVLGLAQTRALLPLPKET